MAAASFVAAWTAAGRRFAYIGLQIAFSFFAVTVATSSAPTELAPARDRLVGVGLALAVMWFVFDQAWPVRTITLMREALASVLRGEAQLLSVAGVKVRPSDLSSRLDGLRHQVSARIAEIRSLNEAELYEFGLHHETHKTAGEIVLRAALSSSSLFWNELAVLEHNQDGDLVSDDDLLQIRSVLAKRLETMADAVLERKPVSAGDTVLEIAQLPPGSREAEYANTMLAGYREVESILLDLPTSA